MSVNSMVEINALLQHAKTRQGVPGLGILLDRKSMHQ